MKRVFFGVTYLILLVMMFVYMLIDCVANGTYEQPLVGALGNTGLPIIGVIIIIPAFIFTIIALATQRVLFEFIRDMFSVFASGFLAVSSGIAFAYPITAYYIPVIEMICCLIVFGLSLYGVITKIKIDDKRKEDELAALEQKKIFDEAVNRKVEEALKAKETE